MNSKRQRLSDVFREFDTDGSLELDHKEFFMAIKTLGISVSKAQAKALFKTVDVDGSGALDVTEIEQFVRKWRRQRAAAVESQGTKKKKRKVRKAVAKSKSSISATKKKEKKLVA